MTVCRAVVDSASFRELEDMCNANCIAMSNLNVRAQ